MKTILCYGDSNTWGWNATTKSRFDRDERWTGILRRELGEDYIIIEEGLNGRTTVWNDPIEGYKNGKEYLIPCLASQSPIDMVVLMLGTNDLKTRFSLTPLDIANGAGVLVDIIEKSESGPGGSKPKILLMCPPPLGTLEGTEFEEMLVGGEEKSKKLVKHYSKVAEQYGCDFLDTSEVIVSSVIDAIHFDSDDHKKLGRAVAAIVRNAFE